MKKVICVLLIALIVLSGLVFAEDVPNEKQLDDLKNLGIMVGDTDGKMRLEETITRAETAKMIYVIMGMNKGNIISEAAVSVFPDVTDSHWAKPYINGIKGLGIIEGDEKGNFNPEADITNEEVIKMLINSLGYTQTAEVTGGYPAGYLRTAQMLGLTEDLTLKIEASAIRADVAAMFSRALDVPIMAQKSWSLSGETEYVIMDGSQTELRTPRTEIAR